MVAPEFSELVGRLLEAMGQQMDAVRPVPEGLVLRTGDRFLFAFLEDPDQISVAFAQSLVAEVHPAPSRLVVLTHTHLPPAIDSLLTKAGATVVQGPRFQELVRQLGLGSFLGEEPRPAPAATSRRLLPSAQQLDTVMHRARTWLEWGVPALALRFYRQASTLKPEFAPARDGVGHALLALGLAEDADHAFAGALEVQPDDLEARVGRAAVLGATGRVPEEVAAYRTMLQEDPARVAVRSHLVAALIAESHWPEALAEIDLLLRSAPEDPQLRFLRSAALGKTGDEAGAAEEVARARRLGLTFEREKSLCEHLHLPAPVEPAAGAPVASPPPARPRRPARRAAPPRLKSAAVPRAARPKSRAGRKPK